MSEAEAMVITIAGKIDARNEERKRSVMEIAEFDAVNPKEAEERKRRKRDEKSKFDQGNGGNPLGRHA